MDEKLSLIFGLLFSDGSVYYDKSKRSYCIQFTNTLDGLRNIFKDTVRERFGTNNFHTHLEKNAISIRLFSVKVAQVLLNYTPTLRKLPCNSFPIHDHSLVSCSSVLDEFGNPWPNCRVPEEIINSKEFSKFFLRGFASGDGTVFLSKKHRVLQIKFACEHPTLRRQISKCLETLGIKSFEKRSGVFISAKSELKKFLDTVGFLPESLISDRKSPRFGIPKNVVLKQGLNFLS